MVNRDDLKTTTVTVTNVDAAVGSNVPRNMRRFIYKIKAQNIFAGVNLLTLGKRENGAVGTTNIDLIAFGAQYEYWNDPEELKEDALPLYIVEGAGAVGASTLRALAAQAVSVYLTVWYIDAPA